VTRYRQLVLTLWAGNRDDGVEAPVTNATGKSKLTRDQLLVELRSAYEGGASIRKLAASTGRSYGSIHSMLRESGTTLRGRGGPNHRARASV
jgi:Helix-turn-helix domain